MSAASALLLLALGAGPTGDLQEEHAALQARLDAERAALDAIADDKKSLLTVLDTLERWARASTERASALEKSAARITRQIAEARADAEVVQAALAEQEARLRPRLSTLYRMRRHDVLGFLLSSHDFASAMKRRRALKTLVGEDMRELTALVELADYEQQTTRRLERLEHTAQRYLEVLREERAVGQVRLARFRDLLASIGAEQNRMSRVIADLEAGERELASMVADLAREATAEGFGALKGQLPFPTEGLVEVGFGRVVNPRFNTVTVQKGLDIRAAEGAHVRAVGVGTVVFAGWLKGYGNLVIVDHGAQFHSLYAHLANAQVQVGDAVTAGQGLGQVGDTGSLKGPYLYFEIRKRGQAVDPLPWLAPR